MVAELADLLLQGRVLVRVRVLDVLLNATQLRVHARREHNAPCTATDDASAHEQHVVLAGDVRVRGNAAVHHAIGIDSRDYSRGQRVQAATNQRTTRQTHNQQ